jgi:hypothetical protein
MVDTNVSRKIKTRQLATTTTSNFGYNYLEVDHWPYSWSVERGDRIIGERLLDIFKMFLFHLLDLGLSRKTLLLHRDHVWTLGEEVSRRLKPQLRRQDMVPVLLAFLDEDGGPVIYPPASSPAQRSFNSNAFKSKVTNGDDARIKRVPTRG